MGSSIEKTSIGSAARKLKRLRGSLRKALSNQMQPGNFDSLEKTASGVTSGGRSISMGSNTLSVFPPGGFLVVMVMIDQQELLFLAVDFGNQSSLDTLLVLATCTDKGQELLVFDLEDRSSDFR